MPINGGYSSFGSDAATPKMEFSSGPAIAQGIPQAQSIHTAGTGLGTMLPHMSHSLDFAADSIAVMDADDCCVDGWADEGIKRDPMKNPGPEAPRSMETPHGGGVYKPPTPPEKNPSGGRGPTFDIKNFMRKGAGDDLALDPAAEDKKRFTESLHHRDSNGHYVKSNTDPKKDKKVYPSQADAAEDALQLVGRTRLTPGAEKAIGSKEKTEFQHQGEREGKEKQIFHRDVTGELKDAASDKMTDPIHEHQPHYPKPTQGEHLPEDSAEDRVPASEVRKHILGPNEKGEYTVGAHHKGDFAASSHIPSEHKAKRLATVLAGKIAKQSVRDEEPAAEDAARKDDLMYAARGEHRFDNANASPTRRRVEGPSKTDYEPKHREQLKGKDPVTLRHVETTQGNKLNSEGFHGHPNKTAGIEERANTYGKLQAARHLQQEEPGYSPRFRAERNKKIDKAGTSPFTPEGRYHSTEEHEKKFGHL